MLRKIRVFFTSLPLTIALLIMLSAVCIIGTLVPQNSSEQEYLRMFSQSTYGLMKTMGLTDMYHCWWFMAVLGLFTLNLSACTVSRLSRLRRLLQPAPATVGEQQLHEMGNHKKFTLKKAGPDAISALAQTVGEFLCAPKVTRQEGQDHIVADKGRSAHLGFYLTHIGMITIIAGVLVGTAGYQGFMRLDEGETQSTITLKNSQAERELGFSVRCDKFEVSYYDKVGMPKDYKSWLTVIEGGKEVVKKVIEVNDPLIYKGIFFYQSSYGTAGATSGEVLVRIRPADGKKAVEYRVRQGQRFAIEGSKDEAVVDTILADFAMDGGKFFSRSDEPNNPAAHVVLYRKGAELENSWAFMHFPDFHKKQDAAYTVELVNFYPRYYTGLQVTRDPGVIVVWVGCVFLIAGICMAFFMSHRRVCLLVQEKDGGLQVVLAGRASKNRKAFAADMTRLVERLKTVEKK